MTARSPIQISDGIAMIPHEPTFRVYYAKPVQFGDQGRGSK
jgi:hypothetical protein